jgi:hypothetical protein
MNIKAMFLSVGLLALPAYIDAHAQGMNAMIQQQILNQRAGDAAVMRLYRACITHPGACKPAPGALEDANRQLQQAYTRQQLNTEKNMDRNYRAINRWDDHAVKGCQYWKDPNTGKIYTNNLSCRFGGR